MSDFRPFSELQDTVLWLHILNTEPVASFELRCVLDMSDFREIVGIEVLDLNRQLEGGLIDPPQGTGEISWSYDSEFDALYIRVREGRGQVQQTAASLAQVDSEGRVVNISVPYLI